MLCLELERKCIVEFLEVVKKNVENIGKTTLTIAGGLFTILSIVLSFITWEDVGITNIYVKILIFLSILGVALIMSILWICIIKRNYLIWDNGDGKINICYADIMKLRFPKKDKTKKIVVIPVNTCFDTIVDENLSLYDKPLVSPTTVHGLWVKNMIKHGFQVSDIDSAIDNYLSLKGIMPIKELSEQEKKRGKRKCFENGTIVVVEGKNNIEFFLLALSEFDENNKAQASKEEVIKCLKKLLEFYDINGQGYQMYITLMGTGRSRAGLTHYDSLQITKSVLSLYNEKIHGTINIVVYQKDRNKVSIFA